jgi:HD-GYP domain-containing protein (c-di-GMP phosphodiesterase class II)
VGKIGVPEAILRKAGPLTDEEYEIVKDHARIGSGIVRNIEGAADIAEVVLHHHERWDGKGYPDGLHQEDSSLLSRILAAADAFDAMCSRRPYRDRLAIEKVIRTVREASGTQFDPRAAEALLRAISEGRIVPGALRRATAAADQAKT